MCIVEIRCGGLRLRAHNPQQQQCAKRWESVDMYSLVRMCIQRLTLSLSRERDTSTVVQQVFVYIVSSTHIIS